MRNPNAQTNVKPRHGEESKPDYYPQDNIQLAGPHHADHQDEYDEPADNTQPQPKADKVQPQPR